MRTTVMYKEAHANTRQVHINRTMERQLFGLLLDFEVDFRKL